MALNSSLSAQGDTRSYRNVLIFSFILNILLDKSFRVKFLFIIN